MSRTVLNRLFKVSQCALIALGLAGTAGSALVNPATAAVDGNTYAVIAPTYTVTNGAQSFIRFFNGTSATSTFTVSVVGSPSGTIYGTTTYAIPSHAEIQKSFTSTILVDTAAGPLRNGDTGYSVYLRNPDVSAGYQHIIFSTASKLYENVSNCKTTINQALAPTNTSAIIGVLTSLLTPLGYPGVV